MRTLAPVLMSMFTVISLGAVPAVMSVNEGTQTRIATLRDEIAAHDRLYDEVGTQVISDAEYDERRQELRRIEGVPPPSKTHPATKSTMPYRFPMTGLPKVYGEPALKTRLNRSKNAEATSWDIEPKYDGIAVKLVYHDGMLRHALTRGNGTSGSVISTPLPIPEKIPELGSGTTEFAGEIYVADADFEEENRIRESKGLRPFAHPRGMALSAIKSAARDTDAAPQIRVVVFRRESTDSGIETTRDQEIKNIGSYGFRTPSPLYRANNIEEVQAYVRHAETTRSQPGFQADGVVIYPVNSSPERQAPFAYKFAPKTVTSVLRRVEYTVGRTGKLTPIAHFDAVSVEGATLKKATLHNIGVLSAMKLKLGDSLEVGRTGGTVPHIRPTSYNPERTDHIVGPTHCPSCEQPLVITDDEPRCMNERCADKIIAALNYAVSKDGLNIRSLNTALIERLVTTGKISRISDLYTLDLTAVDVPLEVGRRIKNEIESIADRPFANQLQALGIEHIGKAQAETIARVCGSAEKLLTLNKTALEKIPISTPAHAALWSYLGDERGRLELEKLAEVQRRSDRDIKKPSSMQRTVEQGTE